MSACGSNAEVGGDRAGKDGKNQKDSNRGPVAPLPEEGWGTGANGNQSGEPGTESDLQIVFDGPEAIDIQLGEPLPALIFEATRGGRAIKAGWSVDRGELGSVSEEGVFMPTGGAGGWVTIRAGVGDVVAEKRIFLRLLAEQNGPTPAQIADGSQISSLVDEIWRGGGIGGVGGEGLGTPLTNSQLLELLAGEPQEDGVSESLELLYPYDGTVFPRGLLAPLLMWRWTPGDAEAIRMRVFTRSGSYQWTGTFGRPAILSASGAPTSRWIRHPIPQDVWEQATQSAGELLEDGSSDTLHVELVIAQGGKTYGPLTRTWGIAPGRLTGTVYYNSYGTNLVQNYTGNREYASGTVEFGAAVLGIRSGDTQPELVSGEGGCKACHTVSAQGTHLLVQGSADRKSNWMDLGLGPEEERERYLAGQDSHFAWAGLSPDGKYALTNAVDASTRNLTVGSGDLRYSSLWDMSQTPPVRVVESGLPSHLRAALPTFSPDGKSVAFAYLGGTGAGVPHGLATDGSVLAQMDFDAENGVFSNFRVLATDGHTGQHSHGLGWPSFSPTSRQVAFQEERYGVNGESYMGTREGARADIWWLDLSQEAPERVRLNHLNGRDSSGQSYLPVATYHGSGADRGYYYESRSRRTVPLVSSALGGPDDDTVVNYEPTVNPVATGGYAWVVFTSRRMYGNVAQGGPWLSDPRHYDFRDPKQITTKKLWVAAVRLDASPGEDPSYPAFYLPAQELLAGNARGYWVVDPCAGDGEACSTGDQCCGGFCQPQGEEGALICSQRTTTITCSNEQERCETSADCCNSASQCINQYCSRPAPPVPVPR